MGLFFGILAGLFDALKNVVAKKNTGTFSEETITFCWMLFATFVTLPFSIVNFPKTLAPLFFFVLLLVTLLDYIAYIYYLRSIKIEDLSLTVPMLSLTPVFVLIISGVFLGQQVKNTGLLGVLLVVLGSYILNISKAKQGFFAPLTQCIQNKGMRYMLFTSFLWGIANSIHKIGIEQSNPLFYTGVSYLALSCLYGGVLLYREKKQFNVLTNIHNIKLLAPVGILEGTTSMFQFLSQGLLLSSVLSISLKRTSIVFSALLGSLFFKEKIKERIVPIILVIVGVIFISL